MLLAFSCTHFQFVQEFKDRPSVLEYQKMVEKLEVGSYDDNIQAKLIRIWDMLPQGDEALQQATAGVFQKIIQLHLNICTKIYIQTGLY